MNTPEGATPFDADGLRLPQLRSRQELNAAEAENIFLAHRKYLLRRNNPKRLWLTDTFIRRVHLEMFGRIWDWAGTYRVTELTIGVPAYRIAEEIKKLCEDRLFWDQENYLPVLERAVRLQARLAWIHPFKNGNGRHARLLMDIFLRSHGERLPEWPHSEMMGEGKPRLDYIAAMKKADEGDMEPLIAFTRKYLKKS